jgi:hypothetical protein
MLTDIPEHGVLFIDEIHRLSPAIEEILYPRDGGLRARHRDWSRGRGARSVTVPAAAVHVDRRDHARRPSDLTAAARVLASSTGSISTR